MQRHFLKLSLIISVIFLGLCSFVFLFLYTQINNNRNTSAQILTEWQNESSRRDEINSLERSLKMIDPEKTLLESHFVQSSNIVPFLDTIDVLAYLAKTKTEVSSVDLLKGNTGLVVGLKASGTFDAVYRFLVLLENAPYEIEVFSSDMQKDAGQDALKKGIQPQWTAVFKIRLLSFVP